MCAKALAELADAKERGYYSIGRAAELLGRHGEDDSPLRIVGADP